MLQNIRVVCPSGTLQIRHVHCVFDIHGQRVWVSLDGLSRHERKFTYTPRCKGDNQNVGWSASGELLPFPSTLQCRRCRNGPLYINIYLQRTFLFGRKVNKKFEKTYLRCVLEWPFLLFAAEALTASVCLEFSFPTLFFLPHTHEQLGRTYPNVCWVLVFDSNKESKGSLRSLRDSLPRHKCFTSRPQTMRMEQS
ncbi:hypothetical protein BaRGS_00015913 [Batillaria attramentaria]|uniref:Uncharacterized protein n=1 Tax=Batillaria attramentaria TaxID=370345 RepID=A0ABD0L0Y4_9CAEN